MARANGVRSAILRRAFKTALNSIVPARHPTHRCAFIIWAAAVATILLMLCAIPAAASETITYTYDARGRLTKVDHGATGPNTGTVVNYTYDKADNRAQVVVNIGGAVTVTLSPTALPNGTVGTSYSAQISASGGTSPYTFSKTGTLPTGLTLSSAGLLSGTPTAAGTYTFTVTATDNASNTGGRSYNPTISSGGVTLTVNPTTLPNGTVGTSYSAQISASGGTSPYTFSKTGTLPTGLTLSSVGLLSGTPTAAGTYTFTVTATDNASNTGSRSYNPTISSGGTSCSGVSFSVNDTSASELDPLVFTITKSGSTTATCSVTYATADGSAIAPGDYAAIAATVLSFGPSESSKQVSVTTYQNHNLSAEPDEIMYLNLSSPSGGATISDPQGVGTIFDVYEDPNPCPLC
jgi:hypothetical protein